MKQFSVEEYNRRKQAGLNFDVITRDGKNVEILKTDAPSEKYPVIILITDQNHDGYDVKTSTANGTWRVSDSSTYDLFFKDVDEEQESELQNLSARGFIEVPELNFKASGLREYYAGIAFVEFIKKGITPIQLVARLSVKYVDALIAELNKSK